MREREREREKGREREGGREGDSVRQRDLPAEGRSHIQHMPRTRSKMDHEKLHTHRHHNLVHTRNNLPIGWDQLVGPTRQIDPDNTGNR